MLKHNLHTINKSLIKDETEVLEHNHRSMKKDEMGTKCASKLGRPVGLTCSHRFMVRFSGKLNISVSNKYALLYPSKYKNGGEMHHSTNHSTTRTITT